MNRAKRKPKLHLVPLNGELPDVKTARAPISIGAIAVPPDVAACCCRTLSRLQEFLLAIEGEIRAQITEGSLSPDEIIEQEHRLAQSVHNRSHLHQLESALSITLERNEAAHERFFQETEEWAAAEQAAGRLPDLDNLPDEGELARGLTELLKAAFGERDLEKPVVN